MTKHVGILGGSFDPPHIAHQLLALSALSLEPIDELWVVPCADHPFAKNLSSFEHRLKMCELAFSRFQNVKVLDVEKHLPTPNYTVRTLEYFLQQQSDLRLSFIIGSDVVEQFSTWHESERILELCEVIVYLREGFEAKIPSSNRILVRSGMVLPGIKSREIRAKANGFSFTDTRVAQYIADKRLYF